MKNSPKSKKIYKGDIIQDYKDYVYREFGERFDENDPDNKLAVEFMKAARDQGLIEED